MPYHDSAGCAGRSARLALLGAGLLALAAPPAWPASAGFLERTPMSQLDRSDIDALNSTVQVVLNTKNDGESTRWSRAATPERAEVDATLTPEDTTISQRRTCRFVAVTLHAANRASNQAPNQTVKLRPQYCRSANTPWELQEAQ